VECSTVYIHELVECSTVYIRWLLECSTVYIHELVECTRVLSALHYHTGQCSAPQLVFASWWSILRTLASAMASAGAVCGALGCGSAVVCTAANHELNRRGLCWGLVGPVPWSMWVHVLQGRATPTRAPLEGSCLCLVKIQKLKKGCASGCGVKRCAVEMLLRDLQHYTVIFWSRPRDQNRYLVF
jgi:hypothetical protein